MYSIEDFAKMKNAECRDRLLELGVKIPTGQHSKLDYVNMLLKYQGAGELTCKIKGIDLTDALESGVSGLLLLNGKPYPPKAEAAAEPDAPAAEAPVANMPVAKAADSNFTGEAAANIARIIKNGATKAVLFKESNNQRDKVPIKHNRSRVLYQVGVWLPIEDKFLQVLETTSYPKDMYVTEGGKTVKKTKIVHRFSYNTARIVDVPELAQFHHLVGKKAAA